MKSLNVILCAIFCGRVEHEKATKLRSPNFHVSTTRLALHNLPKDLMEKDLKELVIKAVKSRASKQHPVVKQVKILRDEVKGMPSVGGRSRGAAFVEFTEHQHALVALRVLNNNPETFSSEHRPIVTFAIENSQILKKRAARNFQSKGGFPQKRTADRQTGNEREDGGEKSGGRKQEPRVEKHASEKEGESRNAIAGSEKQEGGERPGKQKRKREKKKVPIKIGNGDLKTPILGEREVVAAATKRDRKRARKEHENGSKGATALDLKMVAGVNSKTVQGEVFSSSKKDDRQSKSFKGKEQNREAGIRANKKLQQTPPTKSPSLQRQKGVQDQIPKAHKVGTQAVPEVSRRERKHPRAEDKLDQLVAEYRTKYFNPPVASNHNSTGKGSTKVAAGDLRRWFE
jgi:nucleolar protein 4